MREAESTTRERITDRLREGPATLSGLAEEYAITSKAATSHVEHVAKSLEHTDEELLVAPPECRECGFSAFDDLINRPSRCPECKAESVEEPAFRID